MPEFLMPAMGADMDEGTLAKWLVQVGSTVHRGDIVAEVETQKGDIEVEIFQDGVIQALLVPEGTKVAVGTAIATLAGGNGSAPPAAEATGAAAQPSAPSVSIAGTPPAPPAPSVEHVRASPATRRLADELGVDLSRLTGSGVGGRITESDVRTAAASAALEVAPPETAAEAMRAAIGALMARSKREIPHYYLSTHIDMSRATAWLAEQNQERTPDKRLLPAALLLKATALALKEVPDLNGFFRDGRFEPGSGIHLGVAVSLRGGGLLAPAIHDVDQLTIDEAMVALRDLVARARSGRLRSSEMSDPTITVTNLGDQGVEAVFGVIYPPQVALVGFGLVREQPWAEGGMVGARPVVQATLSADHRVTDGHRGAVFLAKIDQLLQEPEGL